MNGVHDLGGMHGFGPVEHDPEPTFHAAWEPVVIAIQNATRADDAMNIDEFRHGIERMDPAHYLASSYFEHWLDGITRNLIEKGVIDPADLDARTAFFAERPDAPATAALAAPPAPRPARTPSAPRTSWRDPAAPPRFAPGEHVTTRVTSPRGHTRLPRYARGKPGVIAAHRGTHVFPDTHAHGQGEHPQPVYSVRFTAQTLWGPDAEPNQHVYLDLWESYLEHDA